MPVEPLAFLSDVAKKPSKPAAPLRRERSARQAAGAASHDAAARSRKPNLQAAFASKIAQRSSYALTHALAHSPSAPDSRHATARAPLFAPQSRWLADSARRSASFASTVRSVATAANAHPAIPPSMPDCWSRLAINAEVWTPLHVATSPHAGWLRPRCTPASLERTGDRYSNVGGWGATPGPGAVTS